MSYRWETSIPSPSGRNRIDANFDWLTLDTPQEEETFGKTGLVVECVFDFVLTLYFS